MRASPWAAWTTSLVTPAPTPRWAAPLRTASSVKQVGVPPIAHLVRSAATWGLNREVGQDAPIWETKRYVEKPILAEGDGPIGEYRRYCKQFYVEKTAKATQLPVVAA